MPLDWRTKLVHPHVSVPGGFHSLVTPVYRGSTTLFESATNVTDHWDQRHVRYSYGLYGTQRRSSSPPVLLNWKMARTASSHRVGRRRLRSLTLLLCAPEDMSSYRRACMVRTATLRTDCSRGLAWRDVLCQGFL